MNETQSKHLQELESLKLDIKEIRTNQNNIQQEIRSLSAHILHDPPAKTQPNSPGCGKSPPEQACNPNNQTPQQSNEDLWLSLSSLTCSPAECGINHDESINLTQSDYAMPSQHIPLDSQPKFDESEILMSGAVNHKRKYTLIYEDRQKCPKSSQLCKGSRIVEDSDSDGDYCSWRSRGEV
jgi:hypothetical protein